MKRLLVRCGIAMGYGECVSVGFVVAWDSVKDAVINENVVLGQCFV